VSFFSAFSHDVKANPILHKKVYEFNSGLNIQEEFPIFGDGSITDPNFGKNELRIQLKSTKGYGNIAFYDKVNTQYGQAVAYNTLDRRWVNFKGKLLYFAEETDGTGKMEIIPFRVVNPSGVSPAKFEETYFSELETV